MANSIKYVLDDLEKQDLEVFVNFQCIHSEMVLFPEQRYEDGYLPYVLTVRSLAAARNINMTTAFFVKRTGRAIGFICGLSYHMARNVAYLEPLTREFSEVEQYPLFVSLCVEKQYRRKSIGSELLVTLTERAAQQQFKTLVVDVGTNRNEGGCTFLCEHGFSPIHFPLLPGRMIFLQSLE